MARRPGARRTSDVPALIWLPEALADIERLHAHLDTANPQAAADAVLCIQAAARRLTLFPEIGAPMASHPPYRQIFAAFGSGAYVLRYRIDEQGNPVIVRVWHSRELRI